MATRDETVPRILTAHYAGKPEGVSVQRILNRAIWLIEKLPCSNEAGGSAELDDQINDCIDGLRLMVKNIR